MDDDGMEFDFDEAELYSALRLVLSSEEARVEAHRAVEALQPGSDWATSEKMLLLLELGSASGGEKVQRVRRALQESRFPLWSQGQRERLGESVGVDELRQRWREVTAAEDREWEEQRDDLRRSLQEQDQLPPDPPTNESFPDFDFPNPESQVLSAYEHTVYRSARPGTQDLGLRTQQVQVRCIESHWNWPHQVMQVQLV